MPSHHEQWFDRFVGLFMNGTEADRKNIILKVEHSRRVRRNAVLIAEGLALDGSGRTAAAMIGLLHDVGRFPQYRDYRTFKDSESVDHAALGARILLEEDVLRDMPKHDREMVIGAVTLHSRFVLPDALGEKLALHARIVRDADKLDIWRIFIELFALPDALRPSAAGLGLANSPSVSRAVLTHVQKGEMVKLTSLRTLNDFKLLQLAWTYDLNFAPSLRLVKERDIITRLAATLPASDDIRRAVGAVRGYVDERLRTAPG